MGNANQFPAGVVTLLQWTMMADGSTYMHLWAPAWEVVTNQATGIEGFRSVERWHLVARDGAGVPLVILPGCQVKGFAACGRNPMLRGGSQVFSVGEARV